MKQDVATSFLVLLLAHLAYLLTAQNVSFMKSLKMSEMLENAETCCNMSLVDFPVSLSSHLLHLLVDFTLLVRSQWR